jgi:hypothetical protein
VTRTPPEGNTINLLSERGLMFIDSVLERERQPGEVVHFREFSGLPCKICKDTTGVWTDNLQFFEHHADRCRQWVEKTENT